MKSNQLPRDAQFASVQLSSRASWIGDLKFDKLAVPVKAHSAIASSVNQLHQIHAGCGKRICQRKVCPEHGELIEEQIAKAFTYSSNRHIALSSEDLAHLAPDDKKTITIEQFFPSDELDLSLLAGRSLFLVPANLAARHSYLVFVAALRQKRVWAFGETVFSNRRQLVVIHVQNESLILHTLHDPALRRAPASLPVSEPKPPRAEVRTLARKIDEFIRRIEWMSFRDRYAEQLALLVEQKVARENNGSSRKDSKSKRGRSRARACVA